MARLILLAALLCACGSSSKTPACSSANCSGCCRADGTCDSDGTADDSCGAMGSLCNDCTSNIAFCNTGACTKCNPGTCNGCCNGARCVDGTDTGACGINGQICNSCPFHPGLDQATCTAGVCGTNP